MARCVYFDNKVYCTIRETVGEQEETTPGKSISIQIARDSIESRAQSLTN